MKLFKKSSLRRETSSPPRLLLIAIRVDKGFGFVEMSSDQEAADAIQKFNGAEYGGRNMTVAEARPMAPREGGGGHRGGGGGRNRW